VNDLSDIICALSTAPGRAGIAVVRISGNGCLALVGRVFVPDGRDMKDFPRREAILGRLLEDAGGAELDRAMVTHFPAPNSYTGEDVAEISLHGSPVIVAHLLDWLCAHGARLARAGEFTLRAFLRGKMDLVQAEAVRDVIEAATLYQARVASRQRAGDLSRQLMPLKEGIVDAAVTLESAIEFAEEDLALDSREVVAAKLQHVHGQLGRWIDSFRRGRLIRDGFSMAVVGRPNVGKSSLFNALLLQDRSIVTEIPGTTRDLVSEFTSIGGIPVRLMDTAGVCDSADRIEKLGVDRSLRAMADADAILLVVDAGQPPSPQDQELRDRLEGLSCIVVLNKADLAPAWSPDQKSGYAGSWPRVEVSTKTGAGLDLLRAEIMRHLLGEAMPERDGILVTNLRHCRSLEAARHALERAAQALQQGLSEEFVLVDLRAALSELGAITGETSTDDLLDGIFSRFCIGK
jgi:tRNA modification GTPase